MRTLFIMPLVLMSLVSSPSWGLSMDDLVIRESLWNKKFNDVPFTGEIDEGLERGSYKNGKREGFWETYWWNGQLSYRGTYRNGKRDGFWTQYDPEGRVQLKHNYKQGDYHGNWESYHEDGTLFEKGEYKDGLRHGRWISYFTSGELHTGSSGQFKNGVKVSD